MRILLVGAGGVGGAVTAIAARREFVERLVVADYDPARSEKAVAALIRAQRITHVFNAVDPRFVMPIFDAAQRTGVDYLDMAMSLSHPHPERPYAETGVMLGAEQFAQARAWEAAGRLALVGIGVEPGLSDVFARYAADHLFTEIEEIGIRDGAKS